LTNNEAQLPIKIALMILGFLEKQSHFKLEEFLKQKKITPKLIAQNDFTVGMSFLKEPILEVLTKEKDYAILYHLTKHTTPNSLGILGYLMIHSNNIYDALNKLCKYYALIGKRMKLIFTEDEEGYKIVLYFYDENGVLMDLENYLVMIHFFNIIHLINYIIPKNIKPKQMKFIQQAPLFSLEEGRIVGIKSLFAQEENSIYFAKNIVKMQNPSANEYLLKTFEKEAEHALDLKLNEGGLKEKIAGLILASSTQLDISLNSISLKAGLTPRVLQKKLKQEGTTFSEILLKVRKKLCIYYLSKDIDLLTISLSIGYLDQSTFFRAFKKWYGMTPSQWKDKNKNNL
jgi:AraC-like DNA-binding protein